MCIWFDVYMWNFDVYVFGSIYKCVTSMKPHVRVSSPGHRKRSDARKCVCCSQASRDTVEYASRDRDE